MIVGFTGTRNGMTDAQRRRVLEIVQTLHGLGYMRYIHGGCMGADFDFHEIVTANPYRAEVRVYPSNYWKTYPPQVRTALGGKKPTDAAVQTAWYSLGATFVAAPAPPLDRNCLMMRYTAECGGVVIATPKSFEEEQRSGTWHAVRRVRALKAKLHIVWPDGSVRA